VCPHPDLLPREDSREKETPFVAALRALLRVVGGGGLRRHRSPGRSSILMEEAPMALPYRDKCPLWPSDVVVHALPIVACGAFAGYMALDARPPITSVLFLNLLLCVLGTAIVLWFLLALASIHTEVTSADTTLVRFFLRRPVAHTEVRFAQVISYSLNIRWLCAWHDGPAYVGGGSWRAMGFCLFHVPWHASLRQGRGVLLALRGGSGVVVASRDPERLLEALEEAGVETLLAGP
jgi:hypothetical protein